MQGQGQYIGATVKRRTVTGEEVHVRHGRGTYTYANGCFTYEGDWVHGVKHGHGVLSCGGVSGSGAPHSVYEGEFVRGEMTGRGLKRWSDGSNYAGSFLDGEMHGEGVWHGVGTKYEGAFQRNHRCGSGTLQCGAGTEFKGEFFESKKHGLGVCKWEDGSSFEGGYVSPDHKASARFVWRYRHDSLTSYFLFLSYAL